MESLILFALSASLLAFPLWFLLLRYNPATCLPKLLPGQPPLPPGGLGFPFIGQSIELFLDFKSYPDKFWKKRNARFGSTGLFKTHLLGRPTVIATSPETIKALLQNDDKFVSGWPKSTGTLAGGKSFLTLTGDDYKRLRRLASSTVNSPQALKRVVTTVESLTLDALNKWAKKGKLLLLNELTKSTFDIISGMVASRSPGIETAEFCADFALLALGLRAFPVNFPGFAYHRALQGRKKVVKRIQGYIDERVAHPNVIYGDILESLMKLTDEEGKALSSEEIVDIIVTFLLAGHESSAHTAMWIMIFLFKNPDKLEKLRVEQQKVVSEKGKAEGLSPSDYRGMTYMSWVIDETLRLVNISPFTFRKAVNTTEINGFTVPQNWSAAAWFRAVHLNEELFPNPDSFIPERWQDMKLKAGSYAPFGMGGRSCIGMDLAKLELAVLVHHVVLKYRWELINPDAEISFLPHPRPADLCPIQFSHI